MSDPVQPDRPIVELVCSSDQPRKAELQEDVRMPEGTTIDEFVQAGVRPVTVGNVRRPKREG